MTALRTIWRKLRSLWQRREVKLEIDEELQFHIEQRTAENVTAGMTPENATREARKRFGNLQNIREECRETRGASFGEATWQDIRFGLRMLRKNPGFTAVAAITLALGIGANTAVFSVVNAVLLRPLPYRNPDQLVTILHDGRYPVAPADFLDWHAQSRSFENMAAAELWGGTLTGGDRPENVSGIRVGDRLLDMLGVSPQLGRTFQADDYLPGNENVVILSHGLWLRQFGGSSNIIGQAVSIDNQHYTVIGVMPDRFQFPPFWATGCEMWAPLSLIDRATDRAGNSLRVFARLKPGVTRQQAQAEMDTICKRLEAAYPDTNTGRTVRVDTLLKQVVGDTQRALMILLGAVGFVLLIACANVANLLLVRAASREVEMAARLALGASRLRIARQLLTESMVIAFLGGILGVAIGFGGVALIKAILLGNSGSFATVIPRLQEVSIDPLALVFTFIITLLTGVIFGLAPAIQVINPNLMSVLKEGGRGTSSGRWSGRLRAALVVSEIALALVMLIGAGLLLRSFVKLSAIDPGFQLKNVLTAIVSLAGQEDFVGPRREMFYQQLFEKINGLPGVQSVAAINHLPLAGDQWTFNVAIEGRPQPARGEEIGAVYRVCTPGYFTTMGIPLLKGRAFSPQDRSDTPGVVIINETFAQKHFSNENPLGKRLTLDDPRKNPTWLTIVGVVKDVKQHSWSGDPSAEVYLPWLQAPDYLEETSVHFAYMTLVIRTETKPLGLVSGLEKSVWSLNKNVPLSSITTLEDVVNNAVRRQRFNLILIGTFTGIALILAGVGIYGVMAFSVTQRRLEFGIRMALGAQRTDIIRLVLRQGIKLALLGVGIGLLAAFALARVMSSLLYEVQPTDALTYALVSLLLIVVALFACWLPARSAAVVDPMSALRSE